LNPVWDEQFIIHPKNRKDTLLIKVLDKDLVGKDTYLGETSIQLGQLKRDQEKDFLLTLQGVDSGQLRLALTISRGTEPVKGDFEAFEYSDTE
jgi:Ca2+-dependent lipid-binding protein